jgi:hypothetical protein
MPIYIRKYRRRRGNAFRGKEDPLKWNRIGQEVPSLHVFV